MAQAHYLHVVVLLMLQSFTFSSTRIIEVIPLISKVFATQWNSAFDFSRVTGNKATRKIFNPHNDGNSYTQMKTRWSRDGKQSEWKYENDMIKGKKVHYDLWVLWKTWEVSFVEKKLSQSAVLQLVWLKTATNEGSTTLQGMKGQTADTPQSCGTCWVSFNNCVSEFRFKNKVWPRFPHHLK